MAQLDKQDCLATRASAVTSWLVRPDQRVSPDAMVARHRTAPRGRRERLARWARMDRTAPRAASVSLAVVDFSAMRVCRDCLVVLAYPVYQE